MKNMKNRLIIIGLCLVLVSPIFIFCINPPSWRSHLHFEPCDIPLEPEVQEFVYYLCYTYEIDYYLVMGLIKTESGFRADAVSKNKDYGLMQINQVNFKWLNENLGITDLLDPYQNIKAGIYMLADLYGKYQSTERVLMAYHLGESGANALWRGGIYKTKYVETVLANAEAFRQFHTETVAAAANTAE